MVISSSAFASATCTMGVVEGTEKTSLGQFVIPKAVYMSTNVRGYTIIVNCDLQKNPAKLALAIVPPQGKAASTTTEKELTLVDDEGKGVFVSCEL